MPLSDILENDVKPTKFAWRLAVRVFILVVGGVVVYFQWQISKREGEHEILKRLDRIEQAQVAIGAKQATMEGNFVEILREHKEQTAGQFERFNADIRWRFTKLIEYREADQRILMDMLQLSKQAVIEEESKDATPMEIKIGVKPKQK